SLSQHPLAKAIVNYALKQEVKTIESVEFQSVTGKGAFAIVGERPVYVGSIDWIREISSVPSEALQKITTLQREGKSVMAIATGTEYSGLIAVADTIREESQSILQKLKE
ncbi:HAD family hydrolase, partial [Microvirga sp. 3-52]|nr:HAD family hydrolase [Microvirga sp. 3-52]